MARRSNRSVGIRRVDCRFDRRMLLSRHAQAVRPARQGRAGDGWRVCRTRLHDWRGAAGIPAGGRGSRRSA